MQKINVQRGFIMFLLINFSGFMVLCGQVGVVKPRWISDQPAPLNDSYQFKVVCVKDAESLDGARLSSVKDLVVAVEGMYRVSVDEQLLIESDLYWRNPMQGGVSDELRHEQYSMRVRNESGVDSLYCERIAEYWQEQGVGERRRYTLYTLYAVGRPGRLVRFDRFTVSSNYGGAGAWRSAILPRWGQYFKGEVLKGSLILGGGVVGAGGLVLCGDMGRQFVG